MKRSWLHLLTAYVEIVLNSGKAVPEFRERGPDLSANRTCDAIAAVMGRVGVSTSALIQTREDLLSFREAGGSLCVDALGEAGQSATEHQVSWMRVPMTLVAVAAILAPAGDFWNFKLRIGRTHSARAFVDQRQSAEQQDDGVENLL